MKKIVHVITTIDRGGAENQLLSLAKAQVLNGYRVLVIAMKGKNELEVEFKRCGVHVYCTPPQTRPIASLLGIYKKIREFNPKLIHAHLPRAELFVACLPLAQPLVVSRHNSEHFFPRAPKILSRALSRFVSFRARRVIFISEGAKAYGLKSKEVVASDKIVVVHYGIENNNPCGQKLGHNSKKGGITRFVTIGRLVAQKDISTQIRAISELNSNQFKLFVVGEGKLIDRLELEVQRYHLEGQVIFLGRTDRTQDVLHSSDCFILSSRYEGFGLVVLEAVLSGLPIIASSIPTNKEILGSDFRYFFEVGDHKKLAEHMQEVSKTNNYDFRKYSEILERFSIEKSMKKIQEVYYKVLADKSFE